MSTLATFAAITALATATTTTTFAAAVIAGMLFGGGPADSEVFPGRPFQSLAGGAQGSDTAIVLVMFTAAARAAAFSALLAAFVALAFCRFGSAIEACDVTLGKRVDGRAFDCAIGIRTGSRKSGNACGCKGRESHELSVTHLFDGGFGVDTLRAAKVESKVCAGSGLTYLSEILKGAKRICGLADVLNEYV